MSELVNLLEEAAEAGPAPAVWATAVGAHDTWEEQVVGVRKVGTEEPAQMGDLIHIGSNAKAMTASLAAEAVQRGILTWDSQASDFFPEAHPGWEGATLELLLRHQAALPPFEEEEHFDEAPAVRGTPAEQRSEFASWVLSEPPEWEPGSRMQYSNAGYGIAGAMIEMADGRPWEQLLQEVLFQPLGIEGGVGWPAEVGDDQPWGHEMVDGGLVARGADHQRLPASIAPAGDVRTTSGGYARFQQMNLRALAGEDDVLPAEILRPLHESKNGAGMGWGVQDLEDGQRISGHAGGAGTFIIVAFVHHQRDLAVAVTANVDGELAEATCVEVLKKMLVRDWG